MTNGVKTDEAWGSEWKELQMIGNAVVRRYELQVSECSETVPTAFAYLQ